MKVKAAMFATQVVLVLVLAAGAQQMPSEKDLRARVAGGKTSVTGYGVLPLSFEANQGQTAAEVKFLSRGRGYILFLTPTEAVLTLQGPSQPKATRSSTAELTEKEVPPAPAVVRMKLLGVNPAPRIVGVDELPAKSNYFIGNNPRNWRTNVSHFAGVRYEEVYPGINLVYYANPAAEGQLEYDFIVAPGAHPNDIRLEFEGTDKVVLDGQSNLILNTAASEVVLRAPVIYQNINGAKQMRSGRYVILDKHQVSFEVAAYDVSEPLIIDPVVIYSTYLGGSGAQDFGAGIAVDVMGNAYVFGLTQSVDFPTANPLDGTFNGGFSDTFVTKLNRDGSALVYSTYLGGSGSDLPSDIAVDFIGNAYVLIGFTTSNDLPTVNPLQAAMAGGVDAFVAQLDPTGSALVYSTYLGGSDGDFGNGIAVDFIGNVYVTGATFSTDFPTASPLQAANAGGLDAFVAQLDPTGSALVYSTYLGGSGFDSGNQIAVDNLGSVYVAGGTDSIDFPTASPLQAANAGGNDAFVTKLSPTGTALLYSTYLGGSNGENANDIAVDFLGNAYVTGFTTSTDFPVVNPFQAANAGGRDAFVAKLNRTGSALLYSTYLGGSSFDAGFAIGLDPVSNVYVTGRTDSSDFPTANPFQAAHAGGRDTFVTKLDRTGSALVYSTYLGGSNFDEPRGIAVHSTGAAYVTGLTNSTNFPTVSPLQGANAGGLDGFVVKLQ